MLFSKTAEGAPGKRFTGHFQSLWQMLTKTEEKIKKLFYCEVGYQTSLFG